MAGRASNGESTIYKGADGRWHGYVSVGFRLDGTIDRRHGEVRVVVRDQRVSVSAVDLGSTNGTIVDGRQVQQALVRDGSQIRIGRTTVYALMKSGELRPVHIGRSCRISQAEVERYVRRLQALPSPPQPSPDAA